MATPDLLTPLMAPALARLRQETALGGGDGATADKVQAMECRCGLNPLTTFYLTGECALFEVLWAQPDALAPLVPAMREEVCERLRLAWRRVADLEIGLFCSLCQQGAARDSAHAAFGRVTSAGSVRGAQAVTGKERERTESPHPSGQAVVAKGRAAGLVS